MRYLWGAVVVVWRDVRRWGSRERNDEALAERVGHQQREAGSRRERRSASDAALRGAIIMSFSSELIPLSVRALGIERKNWASAERVHPA